MFWIRQKSGIDYRVNGDHILALLERNRQGNKTEVEKTVYETLELPQWFRNRQLQGYKVPIDFPEQDVPLAPYFLGLWLGDGSSYTGSIYTVEPEIVEYLKSYAASLEIPLQKRSDNADNDVLECAITIGRGGGHKRRGNEPGWILGQMGLLRNWRDVQNGLCPESNKRIPEEYLANSRRMRLELLAGLIDSDGYLHHTGYSITQKDEALARQIKYLADTLGFQTHIASKKASIKATEYEGIVWRVHIYGNTDDIPVKVERKKAPPRRINKDWRVTGIEIEPDGIDEYFGFVIDGDGLFLLEDMTVTHNTLYAENLAEHWARSGMNVVFVHFELNRALMLDRRMARHTGILRRDLKAGALTEKQEQDRQRANERLKRWDGSITYVHTPGWTMERVMGEVGSLVAEDVCDVFIIDYLEKAAPSNRQLKSFGHNVFAREANTVDSQIVKVRIDKNTMGPCGTFEQYMEGARFLVTDIVSADIDLP